VTSRNPWLPGLRGVILAIRKCNSPRGISFVPLYDLDTYTKLLSPSRKRVKSAAKTHLFADRRTSRLSATCSMVITPGDLPVRRRWSRRCNFQHGEAASSSSSNFVTRLERSRKRRGGSESRIPLESWKPRATQLMQLLHVYARVSEIFGSEFCEIIRERIARIVIRSWSKSHQRCGTAEAIEN
jgi:hypothetical protein